MSKLIELAKKIKALSERGEHGEKINASRMLNNLMQKHGISLADLETENRDKRFFSYKSKQKKLFFQIVGKVLGSKTAFWTDKRKRNGCYLEVTQVEYLEIQSMLDFFWTALEEEMDMFYTAFIIKNEIFPKDQENDEGETLDSKEMAKIINMIKGMDDIHYKKRIQS